jgi:hypothetical protein
MKAQRNWFVCVDIIEKPRTTYAVAKQPFYNIVQRVILLTDTD